MLCQDCKKKPTCKKLCKKAAKWVNQDYAHKYEQKPPINLQFNFTFLSELQNKCLSMSYIQGLSYKQIAKYLSGTPAKRKINHSVVNYQIRSAKRQILQFIYNNRGVKYEKKEILQGLRILAREIKQSSL